MSSAKAEREAVPERTFLTHLVAPTALPSPKNQFPASTRWFGPDRSLTSTLNPLTLPRRGPLIFFTAPCRSRSWQLIGVLGWMLVSGYSSD